MMCGSLFVGMQRHNGTVPPVSLVVEKFRDFVSSKKIVGATKHHLEELQVRIS
jgi:hypothetical protein